MLVVSPRVWPRRSPRSRLGRVAYDEQLVDRIRDLVAGDPSISERRMFGGHAFLVHGHLAASASAHGALMLRVEPGRTESLLDPPLVRRFEMRGQELNGWLQIDAAAVSDEEALRGWVTRGLEYAGSLPPKTPA